MLELVVITHFPFFNKKHGSHSTNQCCVHEMGTSRPSGEKDLSLSVTVPFNAVNRIATFVVFILSMQNVSLVQPHN